MRNDASIIMQLNQQQTEILSAALAYAARKKAVFPCRADKRPYTTRGFKDATTDPDQIRKWWAQWPGALIGLPAGEVNGFTVLDVDRDPDKDIDGDTVLFQLEQTHGKLPNTPETRTPRGGRHIYFKCVPGLPSSAGKLGAGLDIRSEGGYVIAPPSCVNGRRYELLDEDQDEIPDNLAQMPEWMIKELRQAKPTDAPASSNLKIPEGKRNEYLKDQGLAMRRRGLSPKAIAAALQEENAERCDPPLQKQEVQKVARSVSRYKPAPPEPPPYGELLQGAPSPIPEGKIGAELLCAADIAPKAIDWIWPGWLAGGKLHLLAGATGAGKTTVALALAAAISTGGRWPDGSKAPEGTVLIWSGEDEAADTIIPRLMCCGANRNRIRIVHQAFDGRGHRKFDPASDIPNLQAAAGELDDVRLIVVDPVVSVVPNNSHKTAETRRAMQPLVDLGHSTRAAILGITHFTKGTSGGDPVERVTGSLSFAALGRVVLVAAKLPDDEAQKNVRALMRAKSNIGPDTGGFEYYLDQVEVPGEPSMVNTMATWGKAIEGTAREMLSTAELAADPEDKSALKKAKDYLLETLAQGPALVADIKKDAEGLDIGWRTMKRAKDALGIEARKEGFAKRGSWKWRLPDKDTGGEKDDAPF